MNHRCEYFVLSASASFHGARQSPPASLSRILTFSCYLCLPRLQDSPIVPKQIGNEPKLPLCVAGDV